MDKLIIEVALNENQPKAANPNVPITPAEIASDAIRCVNAGASVIHFHARDPENGAPKVMDTALYAEAMRRIQAEANPIVFPTYTNAGEPAQRWVHVHALARDPSVRLETGIIDFGSHNTAAFRDGRWERESSVYLNPGNHLRYFLETCRELELKATPVIRDPGQLRALLAYREEGLFDGPALVHFYFHDEQMWGLDPTIESMQVYQQMLPPEARIAWMASVFGRQNFTLNAYAVLAGGHVRTGLGDNAEGNGEWDSNPKLVERIVTLARMAGREVASPDEARSLIGL
jgi:uncharacterized protein (DUF849 family)